DRDADRNVHLGFRMTWWGSLCQREANDPSRPRFFNPVALRPSSAIEMCVRALKSMGEPIERRTLGELIAIARDPAQDAGRRRGAIVALGEFGLGTAGAVPALVEVIREGRGASSGENPWDSPAALAIEALGKIGAEGDPEVVAILGGLLESGGSWVVP